MQRLELELDHVNFFCPVTRERILSEDDFTPSPAMKFCFVDNCFEYISDDIKEHLASKGYNISKNAIYLDWEEFEDMVNSLSSNNYVLFEISQSSIACGPVSMTAYHCIDMNFTE